MAFPFAPKPRPFTATHLIEGIRPTVREFLDGRRGGNHQRYTLEEAARSALSVFFTQRPSCLDSQRRRQRRWGKNHARRLFGVPPIPSANQLRNRLDPVPPETLFPGCTAISEEWYPRGYLQPFRSICTPLGVPFDGTAYCSSPQRGGTGCSPRTRSTGATGHYPVARTPGSVAPGQETGVPVAPECGCPQEGQDKPDGELAAARRGRAGGGAMPPGA